VGTSVSPWFEECFKQAMPDLFAAQPDLLLQLVTMLSPSLLINDGMALGVFGGCVGGV